MRSGHTRPSGCGRLASSACAHRTQGAFTADFPGSASSRIAMTVSSSGENANRLAARSATPISNLITI